MIKGINLIPLHIQTSWKRRRIRGLFYTLAAVYIILLSALYFNIHSAVTERESSLEALEAKRLAVELQSTGYQSLTTTLAGINKKESDLKRRLDLASGLTRDRVLWSNVLKRMSNDIPKGVWLKSLTTSDVGVKADSNGRGAKSVRLLGSGLTNRAVSDMIFTLENSGYFHKVQLAYTQKKELETGAVYDFEVLAVLRKGVEGIYGW